MMMQPNLAPRHSLPPVDLTLSQEQDIERLGEPRQQGVTGTNAYNDTDHTRFKAKDFFFLWLWHAARSSTAEVHQCPYLAM